MLLRQDCKIFIFTFIVYHVYHIFNDYKESLGQNEDLQIG